jgi:hypothetical protein
VEQYSVDAFSPRLKLELAVPDGVAISIARTIFRVAQARHMARTSVVILPPLDELIEIDTGERMS